MHIVRATEENRETILGLIEDARDYLRTKGTNQWAKPWPTEKLRDAKVIKGLQGKKTWIVWDEVTPAATITIATHANPSVWTKDPRELVEPAVYLHRLVTARKYAGGGLGADLIDWAGKLAASQYGAEWIRIDVWRLNTGLHDYYKKQGFRSCGFCDDPEYPSGALFQKAISEISADSTPQFTVPADDCLV
jgi:Acetyltransferase (GNAT) family